MNSGASFSAAIAWLKAGYKVRRAAWPEGTHLYRRDNTLWKEHREDIGSPTWSDLLAEDWQLVRE